MSGRVEVWKKLVYLRKENLYYLIMLPNTKITLTKKETSLVDVLWNLYVLQTANVKKAFRQKIENDKVLDGSIDDITKTPHYQEAMADVAEGRVTTYNSLKDFYTEMGL